MKNQFASVIIPGLLAFVLVVGCKKMQVDANPVFSAQIQKIVPQALIDSLQRKGMPINQGVTPPKIEGIFLMSPFVLVSSYGPEDSYKPGRVISDYKYKFYEQSTDNLSLKMDFKGLSTSDYGTGKGAFLSGTGNLFTLFTETTGYVGSLVTYKELGVFSGEITPTGIKNLRYGFIMKEKTGDPGNVSLIAVGKSRIYKDDDALAELVTTFRATPPQSVQASAAGSNDDRQ